MIRNYLFIYLCLSLLFVSGCKSEKTVPKKSAAGKKITLKIHAWEGYVKEHSEEFKKYMRETMNMEVELQVTPTSGLKSFISAIKNDGVHLISPANDLLVPLKRENLIKAIDTKKLTKFRQINPVFLKKNVHMINGVPHAVPFTYGPYALAYNKNVMIAPKSYSALWDPKFKKRVSVSGDYDTANIYMTALMLGISPKEIFNLNDEQLLKVEDKLKELCSNQVIDYWGDNINPKKHKEFDIGTDWGVGVNIINKKFGGNWDITIPAEGVTAWVDSWVVSTNVKDPMTEKAVYAFMDFMISPKVQAKVARVTSYAPVNPYAGRHLTAEEKKEYYLTDPKIFNKFILWQPLKVETLKKYQELWKRVKSGK